jgi:hypothetical protein
MVLMLTLLESLKEVIRLLGSSGGQWVLPGAWDLIECPPGHVLLEDEFRVDWDTEGLIA